MGNMVFIKNKKTEEFEKLQAEERELLARDAAGGDVDDELIAIRANAYDAGADSIYYSHGGYYDDAGTWARDDARWESVEEAWECGECAAEQALEREADARDDYEDKFEKWLTDYGMAGTTEDTTIFDSLEAASIQAEAFADAYEGGRWYVFQREDGRFEVAFDEAKVRDGVDESEMLAQFASHCNSGVDDYKDCLCASLGLPSFDEFLEGYEE